MVKILHCCPNGVPHGIVKNAVSIDFFKLKTLMRFTMTAIKDCFLHKGLHHNTEGQKHILSFLLSN